MMKPEAIHKGLNSLGLHPEAQAIFHYFPAVNQIKDMDGDVHLNRWLH